MTIVMHPLCLMASTVPNKSSATTAISSTTPARSTKSTMTTIPTSTKPAETFTLMLSDAEEKLISTALAHDKRINEDVTICYYLGGIVFTTPTSWTLWLNDKAYTNDSDISDFKILNVTKDGLNIKSKTTKGKHGVSMKMDQTFCNDTGSVLGGDRRR